jgi:hypothetical protein
MHHQLSIFAAIFQSRWRKYVALFIAGASLWDLLGAQFLPPSWSQKLPRVYDVIMKTSGFLAWWQWLLIMQAVVAWFAIDFCIKWVQKDRTDYERIKALISDAIDNSTMAAEIRRLDKSGQETRNIILAKQRLETIRVVLSSGNLNPDSALNGTTGTTEKTFSLMQQGIPWLPKYGGSISDITEAALKRNAVDPSIAARDQEEDLRRYRIKMAAIKSYFEHLELRLKQESRLRDE